MAILSPIYAIILPFLFIFTLPIAIFATLTTTLAFSLLFLRVLAVYFELAIAVIPYYIFGLSPPPNSSLSAKQQLLLYPQPQSPTQTTRRKRRTSSSSNLSVKSLSNSGLLGAMGGDAARDYEGVGGWRLGDDDTDDVLWTSHNHRLELPSDHIRRHHRSLTGEARPTEGRARITEGRTRNRSEARKERGSGSWSPENVMNSGRSRVRTPSENRVGVGEGGNAAGYFSTPVSPTLGKGGGNGARSARTQSGSSGSSRGSGERGLSMKVR